MGEFDGEKIKMPRKMCVHAQISGHALEPMVLLNYVTSRFFSNLASNSSIRRRRN